jgi:TetR/AcrR family transcriptional regulator, mexJK operon transcriptional repressor
MLDHYAPALQLLVQNEKQLMEQPPEEVLYRFARAFLRTWENRTTLAVFKVVLGEALRNPTLGGMFGRVGPGRAFVFFNRYLQRQMDLGVMRPMNTAAAVRCFLGPIIGYVLSIEVLRLPDAADLDHDTMARTAVDVFLHGMLVEQREPVAPNGVEPTH